MNATAIDYIWQVIRESERSDEIRFMDDELLITTAAHESQPPRIDQPGAVVSETIAEGNNQFETSG